MSQAAEAHYKFQQDLASANISRAPIIDFLSYIFSVSEEYKDYTFDYDDMAG